MDSSHEERLPFAFHQSTKRLSIASLDNFSDIPTHKSQSTVHLDPQPTPSEHTAVLVNLNANLHPPRDQLHLSASSPTQQPLATQTIQDSVESESHQIRRYPQEAAILESSANSSLALDHNQHLPTDDFTRLDSLLQKNQTLTLKAAGTSVGQLKRTVCCLIRNDSPSRIRWDLVVMALAVISCFVIPFELAFRSNSDPGVTATTTLIDFFFLIDIALNFRTSYVSRKSGKQVNDPRDICRNYCLGRFWLDLLAVAPFDRALWVVGGEAQLVRLLGLLKVLRVLRLSSIINSLNLREQLKLSLKILKLCFFLVLYVHVVACLWFYLVSQRQLWVPPLDFLWFSIYPAFGGTAPLHSSTSPLYEASVGHQYWVAIYHSVLMLTGNEVGPRTTFETAFAAAAILGGAIINANIFGHMAVLVTSLQKNSSLFQERLDAMTSSMQSMRLSKQIQRRVQNYLVFTQGNQHRRQQLSAFLANLSPSLQAEVQHYLFKDVLRRNPVLKQENSQFHTTLVKKLELSYCQPDDELITQGEPEKEAVFFLVQGQCTVSSKDYRSGTPVFVRVLHPGSMFGEVALVYNCKRTATVRAIDYSIVARLSRANFDFVCQQFPGLLQKLRRLFQTYSDPWRLFLRSLLRSIPYLRPLSPAFLNSVSALLSEDFFKAGLLIFKQHDVCQSVAFVTQGQVELCVRSKITGQLQVFDTLKQGANIGAHWVLLGDKYNFHVRAKTDTTIHFLQKSVLMQLKQEEPYLHDELDLAELELERCGSYGGVQCDICHRSTKSVKGQPLMKFRRTVMRMLRFAELRRKNGSATKLEAVISLAQSQKTPLQRAASRLPLERGLTQCFSRVGGGDGDLRRELEEQRKTLDQIKGMLGRLLGQEPKHSKFLDYRSEHTSEKKSPFSRLNSQFFEEQKTRQAQLKVMHMFQEPESARTYSDLSLVYSAPYGGPRLGRLNSRLPLANNSPPEKRESPGRTLAWREDGDVGELIEQMEELVGDKENEEPPLNLESPEQSPDQSPMKSSPGSRGTSFPVIRIEKN